MLRDYSLRASGTDATAGRKTVPIQWSKDEHFAALIMCSAHRKAPIARNDRTLKSNSRVNDRLSS